MGLFDIVGEVAGLLVKGTGFVLNGLTRVVTVVDIKEEYEKRKWLFYGFLTLPQIPVFHIFTR